VAVQDIERLERLALRADVERAVGHHAIDIEDGEAHGAGALEHGRRGLAHTTRAASRSWKVSAPTNRFA
jgi:hypothetical protein